MSEPMTYVHFGNSPCYHIAAVAAPRTLCGTIIDWSSSTAVRLDEPPPVARCCHCSRILNRLADRPDLQPPDWRRKSNHAIPYEVKNVVN